MVDHNGWLVLMNNQDDAKAQPAVVPRADFSSPDPNDPCGDFNSPSAEGGVYVLRDGGTVVRTGRTNNLHTRELAHKRSHPNLTFQRMYTTNNYILQRGLEDYLFHTFYETAWHANGGLNMRRAIGEWNLRRHMYRNTTGRCLGNASRWWE